MEAPAGIERYQPSSSQLNAVRSLAPVNPARETLSKPEIEAIYLMGSAGSLAQTRASDIDVWICLKTELHPKLAKKVSQLETWARSMGLELQMFLVEPQRFKDAEPTDNGYSPLLLDEFYRSGCHIAGRYPMWWLTPINCAPSEYVWRVESLRERHIVDPQSFHDFGPVQPLSLEAIICATVTQFEQSLHTPYKSLLKLGLLESYFYGAPLLSERYKATVLNDSDVSERDVYTLLIAHLEHHFARDPERTQFFRTAWLTKSIRGNSRLNRNPVWRERAHAWGFEDDAIEHLRWPQKWPAFELLREQSMFAQAYAAVRNFCRDLLSERPGTTDPRLIEGCLNVFARACELASGQGALHPKPVPNYTSHAQFVRTHQGWDLQDRGVSLKQATSRATLLYWLKTKGLPVETLNTHKERWINKLWPLIDAGPLLIVNAEPEPERAAKRLTNEIWSTDFVNGTSQTQLSFGDALAAAINHSASVTCVDTIRAPVIEQRLGRLIDAADKALDAEGAVFLSMVADKPHAWIKQGDRVISRVFEDKEVLITDLPCSSNISGLEDDEPLWLELLTGPTLFVSASHNRAELTYRDQKYKYQIAAPHRPLTHFYHSIKLFVGILSRRGIPTPKVFAQMGPLPKPDYSALGFKLIFRSGRRGWEITSGHHKFTAPTITKTLLRQVRASVLAHRRADDDYPIYLTDLDLPNEDFHTHLVTKLRIERLLSLAPQPKP